MKQKKKENFLYLICNNPNLDVFNINAYATFDQIPSTIFQDIERKQNSDINQEP